MVFSSLEFIFIFLPCFLLVYYLLPVNAANVWIVIGSLFFYAYGVDFNPWYVLLMVIAIAVNFRLGQRLAVIKSRNKRKKLLIKGLIYNFSWLIFFKYLGLPILMPVGISFYTFQISSYLVDVYRRETDSERSPVRFGAYVMLFPQLIAGPIVTYDKMKYRLRSRRITCSNLNAGLKIFSRGLALKVLLANRFGSLWYDVQAIGFESITTPLAWMGITAFSFQIYFDFYGYSLMAKGLGKIMGFELPDNFRHPYMSRSMTEFWRRWHMTLGSWFRDYVYIPLGGNRKGRGRQILNLLVVWVLTGVWHGSSWNFLAWGLFLFIVMTLETFGIKKLMDFIPPLGHLYMLLLLPISWCFFEISNLQQLEIFLRKLFPFGQSVTNAVFSTDYIKYLHEYGFFLVIGLIFCTDIPLRIYRRVENTMVVTVLLLSLFWLSVYFLYLGMNDPFLYYRF